MVLGEKHGTNYLPCTLKLCGMAQLYPKLKRDAIIYYGLQHGLGLFEINDKLFDENEETLF